MLWKFVLSRHAVSAKAEHEVLSRNLWNFTIFHNNICAQSMKCRPKLCRRSMMTSALQWQIFLRFGSFTQQCTLTVDLMALRQLPEHRLTSKTPILWSFGYRIDEKKRREVKMERKNPLRIKTHNKRATQSEHKRGDGQKGEGK